MQMRKKEKAQLYFLVERVVRLGRVSSVFSGLILVAASLELKSFTSTSFLDDDDDDAVLDLKNLFSTFAVAEAAGCWRSRSASAVALLEDVVLT